ncbi:MAG: DedA family protein [Geobacteraceae bacterium]|nr:DedA family protein [Geobacteraceae bacterium]
MENFLYSHGYPALFLLSFLAATILPLGSEWLLAALVVKGMDPVLSIAVATAGNTLGACTTFGIGLYGGPFLIDRVLRISDESRCKAETLFGKYGLWSLLFSWVPVVGDPLCFVAGVLRIQFALFVVLVLIGKLARYGIISLIAVKYQGF